MTNANPWLDLPPGDYACLRVIGGLGEATLAGLPPLPRTAVMGATDGSERIIVFTAGPDGPAPGEELPLGPGLTIFGARIGATS